MENETQNQVMPENENKEEAPKKKERKSLLLAVQLSSIYLS